jgi:hypothetical protein
MIPPALLLALAMSPGVSGRDTQAASLSATHPLYGRDARRATRDSGLASQHKGRYKKQGNNCEWDANDSGPNQCTPLTKGRFKKSGDTCAWAANDVGPDQCRPAKGRWAKSDSQCRWRPNDNGPDQCNPRQPR